MELFTFDRCIKEEEIYDFEKKYFNKTKFNDFCCGKDCFISKYNAYYVKDNQLIDINSGVVCDDYEYLRIILEKLYTEKIVLYKGEKHFNEILELLKELYAQKYKAPNIEEMKKKIK